MTLFARASIRVWVVGASILGFGLNQAQALDLDWHGQFRSESHTLFGFSNGTAATTGYTVPDYASGPATFQNLFFRLNPRVLVNDNVTLHSDLWLGTPDQGLFGRDGSTSATSPTSYTYRAGSTGNAAVRAQTLYAEVATDFGTLRVGRTPLQYGLGLIWNSESKNGFDRLPSNGDSIGLVTKFGAFKFMPTFVKYQAFNNATGSTTLGNSGVSDYTLALAYENDDEQAELGVMFMRRIAGQNANVVNPFSLNTVSTAGYGYNIWDFSAKKRSGPLTVSAEVPLASGTVAGKSYSSVAGAVKADIELNDRWQLHANAGTAGGQDGGTSGSVPNSLSGFAFHPDFRPALIMFNYNLRNFSNNSGSIFDQGITNARFLSLGADLTSGKFSHGLSWIYAVADKVADGVSGNTFFNTWDGYYRTQTGGAAQEKSMGFEFDYRLGYQWDEAIHFGLDLALYMPGKYFEFANAATTNTNKTQFLTAFNMNVKF